MKAYELSERLVIQEQASGVNVLGEKVGTWATFATVWGKAEPIRGSHYFSQGQNQMLVDVKFTIRHRTDIENTMRVMWRGEPYKLVSPPIDVNGQKKWLELMCKTND